MKGCEILKDQNFDYYEKRLKYFEKKWEGVRPPNGFEDEISKISEPLVRVLVQLYHSTGVRLDYEGWCDLVLEKLAPILVPWIIRCYLLGYELAAGNVSYEEVSFYLLAAKNPIEEFASNITGKSVLEGKLTKEEEIKIISHLGPIAIDVLRKFIFFGINNYHKVGR